MREFCGRKTRGSTGLTHLPRILVPMTVKLTPRAQELLEAALDRGVGRSIKRALEAAATSAAPVSEEEREQRRQAVASMLAFREEFHLTLAPAERIQDLVHG